jgi:hypothetical protein
MGGVENDLAFLGRRFEQFWIGHIDLGGACRRERGGCGNEESDRDEAPAK